MRNLRMSLTHTSIQWHESDLYGVSGPSGPSQAIMILFRAHHPKGKVMVLKLFLLQKQGLWQTIMISSVKLFKLIDPTEETGFPVKLFQLIDPTEKAGFPHFFWTLSRSVAAGILSNTRLKYLFIPVEEGEDPMFIPVKEGDDPIFLLVESLFNWSISSLLAESKWPRWSDQKILSSNWKTLLGRSTKG